MLEILSNRFQGTRQVLVPQSAMPGKRSAACVLQVTMQAGLLGPGLNSGTDLAVMCFGPEKPQKARSKRPAAEKR